MTGQAGRGNGTPPTAQSRDLYFFKVDTSGFTADPKGFLDGVGDIADKFDIDTGIFEGVNNLSHTKELKDFYQVGLWSHCEGEVKKGVELITYCSSPNQSFWFNPTEVWGLQSTFVQNALGENFQTGLHIYKSVIRATTKVFIATTVSTAAVCLVGFSAVFSRLGSLATMFLSLITSDLALIAATVATTSYGVLVGGLNTALQPYNIRISIGTQMLWVLWLSVVFNVVATSCWLPSVFYGKA